MKKITILLLVLVLLTGCGKLSKDVIKQRGDFVSSIGVTNDKKIVISNKKKNQYYVYYISSDYSYMSYLYIMHNNKKDYDKYIKDKDSISYYDIKKYDNLLITRINYLSGSSRDNKSIKDEIIEKYKNDKNYEIIY